MEESDWWYKGWNIVLKVVGEIESTGSRSLSLKNNAFNKGLLNHLRRKCRLSLPCRPHSLLSLPTHQRIYYTSFYTYRFYCLLKWIYRIPFYNKRMKLYHKAVENLLNFHLGNILKFWFFLKTSRNKMFSNLSDIW